MYELIESSWQLDEVRAIIPTLQMRGQAQRGAVTCLKSHSKEVVVLTLDPMDFSQAAQGNLQPPLSPHTPRKGQLGSRVMDRGIWA